MSQTHALDLADPSTDPFEVAAAAADVIRELGYWALLLSSFCLLLRDIATPRAAYLLGWALCTLLAATFKPEELLFGVLPLALLGVQTGAPGARCWRAFGAFAVMAYSAVVTYLIALIIKHTIGWRISTTDEVSGIDLVEHSEAGYDLSPVYYTNKVQRTLVLSKDDLPEIEKSGAAK